MARTTALRNLAIAAGLSLAAAGGALAQSAAEQAVTARQAGYKQIGAAFKAINDEMRQRSPDMGVVAQAARTLKQHADRVPGWFPKGSGPETRLKTDAKAEIWTDAAGFAAASQALQAQATRMQQLAVAGDVDGVKAQIRTLGGTCKSCHDKYRAEQ